MQVIERAGDRINLTADFRDKERIKQIPGARWDNEIQTWWLPLSWAACVQARGVFGADLQVGPALATWSRNEIDTRIQPCMELRTAPDALDFAIFGHLRPFQRAAVSFLKLARFAICADEMGLGKTVEAIATLEAIGDEAYPALVVSPNSMKLPWAKEFEKWAPGRRVSVSDRTAAKRRKAIAMVRDGEADVLVINYEALRYVSRLAFYPSVTLSDKDKLEKELNEIDWAAVVADEAHRLADPRSQQTRAAWYVSKDARTRIGLTGSPVVDAPEDMWALMRFVAPHEFPAKGGYDENGRPKGFIGRYGQRSYSVYGYPEISGIKSETSEELFKIIDPRLIRRTKKAVFPEIPDAVYATRYVEMEAKQKKAYDEIRKHMLTQLDGGVLMTDNPLTRMLRMSQFASAMGEINESGDLILTAPSCKVDALMDLVEEVGDERVVVFAESRQLIEIAATALVKAKITNGSITGAVSAQDRMANVEAFNASRLKVLLITLGAGGEGLSLPGCNTAIFLQRSWSRVKNEQAEARISGIGRGTEGVAPTYIDVITSGTCEEDVFAALADKARVMEEIVRDEETVRLWLNRK